MFKCRVLFRYLNVTEVFECGFVSHTLDEDIFIVCKSAHRCEIFLVFKHHQCLDVFILDLCVYV